MRPNAGFFIQENNVMPGLHRSHRSRIFRRRDLSMTSVDRIFEWNISPPVMAVCPHEVHVWRASLELGARQILALRQILSADELATADRFHFEKHRRRYIAARGALRTILGRYLGLEASELAFRYSSYGKPRLATESDKDCMQFNVSHSHELALFAVTGGPAVGVDIEYMRDNLSIEEIAERHFSPREFATFRALTASQRMEGFFNCWTRKEAYIKARGEGLSFPLERFEVSLAPGQPPALLGTEGDPLEAARWSMSALSPGIGYSAALVVEGKDLQLTRWQWAASPPTDGPMD